MKNSICTPNIRNFRVRAISKNYVHQTYGMSVLALKLCTCTSNLWNVCSCPKTVTDWFDEIESCTIPGLFSVEHVNQKIYFLLFLSVDNCYVVNSSDLDVSCCLNFCKYINEYENCRMMDIELFIEVGMKRFSTVICSFDLRRLVENVYL